MTSKIVRALLGESEDDVVIELHTASVDSMPHVTWLVRHKDSSPTQYLAKGTAHSKEEAKSQVQTKVRLLGVRVAQVVDNT